MSRLVIERRNALLSVYSYLNFKVGALKTKSFFKEDFMDFLILPTSPETGGIARDCTCFMGASNSGPCTVYIPVCTSDCSGNCSFFVCGRGVARRITI